MPPASMSFDQEQLGELDVVRHSDLQVRGRGFGSHTVLAGALDEPGVVGRLGEHLRVNGEERPRTPRAGMPAATTAQ